MSSMSQILRNQRSGQVGPKDPMHRTLPDSQRFLDPMTGMWSDPAGLPFIPRAMGGPIGFGNGGGQSYNAKDFNDYNAAVNKMNQDSQAIMRGSMLRMNDPNRITSVFLPLGQAPAQRGGGGGGGGGRMGDQDQQKIMNVGPRTGSDYAAKHGGLSPQRPSALDAAYAKGNLTNPRVAEWLNNKPKPAAAPLPANDSFAGGAGMGMGAAVGQAMVPMINTDASAAKSAAISQSPEGRWLMNSKGDDFIPIPKPSAYSYDEMTAGEVPVADFAQASVTQSLGSLPGQKAPTPMAKGGSMHPGKKPYLVGEEGPELILPREDGSGFVLPADVTAQVLPAMRDVTPKAKGGKIGYTPRAEGGLLELRQPLGDGEVVQRGFDMGPGRRGFATTVTGMGADASAPAAPSMILDPSGRYQLDTTAPGMPMLPDTVSGPWAEPGLPAPDMSVQQDTISRRVAALPGRGATPVVDPLAAMRERGALAMIDLENRRFDQRQAEVQQELAARAARAPLGTPTAPAAPAMDRNMERFMRTPEGMRMAMEQQGRLAELEQRSQLASRAIAVRDEQGNIRGYTTGTGASLPNPETSRPRIGKMGDQWVQLNDDGTTTPFNAGTEPKFAWNGSQFIQLPPDIDETKLPPELKLVPRKGAEVGGAKTDTSKPGTAAAGAAKQPVRIQSPDDIKRLGLKPGDPVILPSGKLGVVPKMSKDA